MKNYILKEEGIKFINDLLHLKIRDFYIYNKLISNILKIKTNIPIYVDKYIVFLPIKSYKAYDCIWISYKNIKEVIDNKNSVIIKFLNGEIKSFDINFNKLNRIIKNANIIINYFEKIECENEII